MLKLQHITLLLAIENCGSIRAAAKLIGKTQPAVTKALRQAEADLGASIFKRSPSGVVVTEEGKTILRRASVIQAELRKMQDEVDQIKGRGGGSITVTVSPLVAMKFIPPAYKRFRRRFPETHVQINGGHEPMAFGPLKDGKADIVIGPVPIGQLAFGLTVEPLTETPVVIITGKGSRWENARSLRELTGGDWIMIGTRERILTSYSAFLDAGLAPPEPSAHSDSIFSVLSIIQDSDYLCTFPQQVLDEIMQRWRIVQVPITEPLPAAMIAVTTASDRPLTPAARHFCDCVHQVALSNPH